MTLCGRCALVLLVAVWPVAANPVGTECSACENPETLSLIQTRIQIRPPLRDGQYLVQEGDDQVDAPTSAEILAQESVQGINISSAFNFTAIKEGLSRGSWEHWAVSSTISWALYLVLALLVWVCCYPAEPQMVFEGEDPQFTFQHSHFGCFKNPGICCCACFCPGLRWSDTMRLSGFLPICTGLTAFFVCALLNGLVYTNSFIGPVTCLLLLYYRQKLRGKLALHSCTAYTCCVDFLYVLLCPWCAIAQEARVVQNAYKVGTPGFGNAW